MPKKYRDLAEIASDKNKDTEQRNLAGLIEAAVTNGLIALKDFDRGVFTFTSDGGLRTYRVFFDEPAEAKGAERIIRASEFVTAIFDKINTSYNCYFAPATNTGFTYMVKLKSVSLKWNFFSSCGPQELEPIPLCL